MGGLVIMWWLRRVLNNDLAADFRHWYPGFAHKLEAAPNDQLPAA